MAIWNQTHRKKKNVFEDYNMKLKSEVLNDKFKKNFILTFYFFVIEFFQKLYC